MLCVKELCVNKLRVSKKSGGGGGEGEGEADRIQNKKTRSQHKDMGNEEIPAFFILGVDGMGYSWRHQGHAHELFEALVQRCAICIHLIYIRACMHTCIHAYMHACMHANIHTYIHTCIHAYMRTYVHTYIHAYIHAWMDAWMHVCVLSTIYIMSYRVLLHNVTLYFFLFLYSFDICILVVPGTRRGGCFEKVKQL